MQFNKLRLMGFKSFVEPTEFSIERGLTGVVGPNGCGKSNLVEALRWVMGENSYKNMRASSMDDVIFSGSGGRPARNTAEVTLFLNNEDRSAPAAFNDSDELQVSRRIERESGSQYRINGKEVRAKDVQLLFADASTGARSPSMIGQGRIGELISAKPQARRALLEEAAGISGLHSRRHEAELKLRASETNLERLDDVIAQMESQLDSLKRQARQANRYRSIASDIRKAEATLLHLRWVVAKEVQTEAKRAMSEATVKVGERALIQAETAKVQAVIAHELPQLRDAEVKAAAAFQHLSISRKQLDDEDNRAKSRAAELVRRIEQLGADIEREKQLIEENSDVLAHLAKEFEILSEETERRDETEADAKSTLAAVSQKLAATEEQLNESTARLASVTSERNHLQRTCRENEAQRDRLGQQLVAVGVEIAEISAKISGTSDIAQKREFVQRQEELLAKLEKDLLASEALVETARTQESDCRTPLDEARAHLSRIETEAKTLARILNRESQDLFSPVVEKIDVKPGFEKALAAALGDDLDAPLDSTAPAYWSPAGTVTSDPNLPDNVIPLLDHINAPVELTRRLSQIGVVDGDCDDALVSQLLPGQRLVSKTGGLWRWDGYVVTSDAPTAIAQRLEQKNRLSELDEEAIDAAQTLEQVSGNLEHLQSALLAVEEKERTQKVSLRSAQSELNEANRELSDAERAQGELSNHLAAKEEAQNGLQSGLVNAKKALTVAELAFANLPATTILDTQLQELNSQVMGERAISAEARAKLEGMLRENEMRTQRMAAIGRERENWINRAAKAEKQIAILNDRLNEAQQEQQQLENTPSQFAERRRSLLADLDKAEETRKKAADQLAIVEQKLTEADRHAAATLGDLSTAKEESARAEERLNAAQERRSDSEARIREELECQPHEAVKLAEIDVSKPLPEADNVERKLERLRNERERLGAVNLRAEDEQTEIAQKRDDIVNERDDLIEAIRKLRQAIQSLNREGRERLLVAFEEVNVQFQKLFTHLFGGGTAELQLIESDDPLEAGLEILARPPGKKPQTMTLLSGGEQALTAMALIFAVFLTNPAPICVLDEVDAPLDDHNVDRFCSLMDQMAESTDTRFVLITHNPITMARVDRLFGVTMAERGVSQLVSVDLQTAEGFRDAG